MQGKVRRLVNGGMMSSVDVILRWRVQGGLDPGYNPKIEGTEGVGFSVTDEELTVKALYHAVTVGQTGYQRNVEIRKGDVILGFADDVDLSGKDGLRFEVNGVTYVQHDGGGGLAETWDAMVEGLLIVNEILVRPVGGVPSGQ